MAKSSKGYDREAMRKQLADRKKVGDDRKTKANFKTFLVCPVEDEVSFYKPSTDGSDHWVDILPYQAGNRDPLREVDEWTHCLDIFVHQNVGVNNDQFVCPQQNYGKKCPICEERKRLYEQGEEDAAKKLWPSRRTVYNIICYDDKKEEAKGVQLFQVAYNYLEEPIQKLAAKSKRKGEDDIDPNVLIADPVEGRTISFNVDSKTITINNKAVKVPDYSSYELEKRDYEIDEQDLKNCYVIDKFLYLGEDNQGSEEIDWESFYKEIYESFNEEEFNEKTSKVKKEEELAEEDTGRRGRNRNKVKEEIEDEKETRRSRKGKEEEVDKTITKKDCPGEFGVDVGTFDECANCDDFADCAVEKKNKEKANEDDSRDRKGRRAIKEEVKEDEPVMRHRRRI